MNRRRMIFFFFLNKERMELLRVSQRGKRSLFMTSETNSAAIFNNSWKGGLDSLSFIV